MARPCYREGQQDSAAPSRTSVVAASPSLTAGEEIIKYDNDGDGLFALNCSLDWRHAESKIDQSIAIVTESAKIQNANFPLKSKAKKSDGLVVGFRPSEEDIFY